MLLVGFSSSSRVPVWGRRRGGVGGIAPLPSTRPDDATRHDARYYPCAMLVLTPLCRRRTLPTLPRSGGIVHRHCFIFTIEGPHGLLKMSAPDDAARDAWKKALADAIADVSRTTRGYLLVKVKGSERERRGATARSERGARSEAHREKRARSARSRDGLLLERTHEASRWWRERSRAAPHPLASARCLRRRRRRRRRRRPRASCASRARREPATRAWW